MFELLIKVATYIFVASFMLGVLISLQQIAKDLRVIAGRYDPKPHTEAAERLGDA